MKLCARGRARQLGERGRGCGKGGACKGRKGLRALLAPPATSGIRTHPSSSERLQLRLRLLLWMLVLMVTVLVKRHPALLLQQPLLLIAAVRPVHERGLSAGEAPPTTPRRWRRACGRAPVPLQKGCARMCGCVCVCTCVHKRVCISVCAYACVRVCFDTCVYACVVSGSGSSAPAGELLPLCSRGVHKLMYVYVCVRVYLCAC